MKIKKTEQLVMVYRNANKVFVSTGQVQVTNLREAIGTMRNSVEFTAAEAEVRDSIVAALERRIDNMRAQLRELGVHV
jgi:hypothetical protein